MARRSRRRVSRRRRAPSGYRRREAEKDRAIQGKFTSYKKIKIYTFFGGGNDGWCYNLGSAAHGMLSSNLCGHASREAAVAAAKDRIDSMQRSHNPIVPYETPEENPQPSTWIIIGLVGVIIAGTIYWMTSANAPSAGPSGTYRVTTAPNLGLLGAGTADAVRTILIAQGWTGVTSPVANADGSYSFTGTYSGSVAPTTPGATITKIG
jgi:hypothetical protein